MSVEYDAEIRKLQTSIVDVIRPLVSLKKSGDHYLACCPFHDDRTPSMTVHDNKSDIEAGWFNCFGCGAGGDVYDFLQRYYGVSFLDAVSMLGGLPRMRTGDLHQRPVRSSDKQKWIQRIWDSRRDLQPCSPAGDYLASRGIPVGELGVLENLGETRLQYRNDGNEHPVLLAAIRDGQEGLIAVQRTYLTERGAKLEVESPKMTFGPMRGGAIKIGSTVEELIICEGLEDALSLRLAFPSTTVWAAAGSKLMPHLPIPDQCTKLIVAQDNDEAGRAAAKATAKAFRRPDREILSMSPAAGFKDFNDELKASTLV